MPWRDLMQLTRRDALFELLIPLPWLGGSLALWYLALHGRPAVALGALGCAFMFFLTGLRVVHNAFHYALGIPRGASEIVMHVLSVVMGASMHAIQVTHLHHHRHCLDDDDIEGSTARMPAWRALLYGPLFPLRLHYHGIRLARGERRRRILIDGILLVGAVAVVMSVSGLWATKAHLLTMAAAQSLTGFFAVWTVHHDCDGTRHIARTQRGWFKNLISYDMFFHVEHHLFPAVPTRRLPELARRLDAAAPELKSKSVF